MCNPEGKAALKEKPSNWPGLVRYSGMGFELAAAIVACTLVGLWVDHRFGTGRKGITTGAILGIVGGTYNFVRQAVLLMKQDATKDGDDADHADDTDQSE